MAPHFVAYSITNIANGKKYIGITGDYERRRKRHLSRADAGRWISAIHAAIAKYGADSFRFDQIACARSWADLLELERILIAQHGTFCDGKSEGGYNLTTGGDGVRGRKHTMEWRERRSKACLGRTFSEETLAKLRAARLGKPLPPAAVEASRKARMGMRHTPEHCANIAKGNRGKRMPQSAKDRIRDARYKPIRTPDGTIFANSVLAGEAHGISPRAAALRALRRTKGWQWASAEVPK